MQKTMIAVIILFIASITNKTVYGIDNHDKPREQQEIKLQEETRKTRSLITTEVNAYTDGKLLTVEVVDYDGDVYVQVFGADGELQGSFSCYQIGYSELDIESLPSGTYTVSITLDKTYSGIFMK